MKGVFGDGGSSSPCSPASGGGRHECGVPGGLGISRRTGHRIFNRYKAEGIEALCDRSRRPAM